MGAASLYAFESRSTILVVEDDHDIRVSVRGLLEAEGYRVLTVTDGASALALLEATTTRPSLIILDLMLPVMDGWHFVAELRRRPHLLGIPIVVMSAYDDPPPPDGTVARVRKPFRTQSLLRLVSEYCE